MESSSQLYTLVAFNSAFKIIVTTFDTHLQHVFQPNSATRLFVLPKLTNDEQSPHDPIEFRANELTKIVKNQPHPKNSSGCNVVTPKMIESKAWQKSL